MAWKFLRIGHISNFGFKRKQSINNSVRFVNKSLLNWFTQASNLWHFVKGAVLEKATSQTTLPSHHFKELWFWRERKLCECKYCAMLRPKKSTGADKMIIYGEAKVSGCGRWIHESAWTSGSESLSNLKGYTMTATKKTKSVWSTCRQLH